MFLDFRFWPECGFEGAFTKRFGLFEFGGRGVL